MRTAIYRRANSYLHYFPMPQLASLNKKKLKTIYSSSIKRVKQHPYRSIGILALGLSVLSGCLVLVYKMKK